MSRSRLLRRFAAVISVTLAVDACAPSRAALGTPASGPLRETIVAVERGAWEAWQRKDGKFFRETLLANAAYVSGDGVTTRDEIARQVETNTCTVHGFELRNQEVRSLSADVALLTFRATSDQTCDTRSIHADAWVSTVFVRDGDSWKVSFHQETDVPK